MVECCTRVDCEGDDECLGQLRAKCEVYHYLGYPGEATTTVASAVHQKQQTSMCITKSSLVTHFGWYEATQSCMVGISVGPALSNSKQVTVHIDIL